MEADYEPLSKRDAAVLIQSIRENEDWDTQMAFQTAALNLIWSFRELSRDEDFSDMEMTEEEAEEILSEFPTSFEEESA